MENKFLGTGWSFPPEFHSGGSEVIMVSGEEDIKQSIQILLSTSLQERVMNPDYGSELNRFLFEETNQGLISDIKSTVSDAILHHEPRILLNEVKLDNSDLENGLILISINYTVDATNNRYNLVFPYYINEASI